MDKQVEDDVETVAFGDIKGLRFRTFLLVVCKPETIHCVGRSCYGGAGLQNCGFKSHLMSKVQEEGQGGSVRGLIIGITGGILSL